MSGNTLISNNNNSNSNTNNFNNNINNNNDNNREETIFDLFNFTRGRLPRLVTILINNRFLNMTPSENETNNNGPQHPMLLVRERIFRSIFTKLTVHYAISIPKKFRKLIEYIILFLAFLSLFTLSFLHVKFIRQPINCLDSIQDSWPLDGILRVEIVSSNDEGYDLVKLNEKRDDELEREFLNVSFKSNSSMYSLTSIVHNEDTNYLTLKENLTYFQKISRIVWPQEHHVVEYSLEYGFLRLSPSMRQKLNIPVKIVLLDPNKDECFGDCLSRFLLKHLLGYDDILMGTIQTLAGKQDNKGYVRNVVTGEHYRFVNGYMARTAYLFAFFIMLVFTLSISMLLRFSHHQVFIFVAELLQMMEFNINFTFPFAPLITVILALVGMEAIMSEFFNDTTTAFYVILIVWAADQYDAFCCHTNTTRRHWLKFFYLYHFLFYAYDYRFNGQYSGLALLTSCLFILHSMIYFFHRYELPPMLNAAMLSARSPVQGQTRNEVPINNNESNIHENIENEGDGIVASSSGTIVSLSASITYRQRNDSNFPNLRTHKSTRQKSKPGQSSSMHDDEENSTMPSNSEDSHNLQ